MLATELQLHEATFRAFGSNCRVVSDVRRSVTDGLERLEDLEARWSRFRPDSEVSAINEAGGDPVEVSAITCLLVERANEAARRTNGVFNPALLDPLRALGYDRSNELLCRTTDSLPSPANPDSPMPRDVVQLEIDGGRVTRPTGGFDPGGLGKGLAADLVLTDLIEAGATWAMVSLGGDIRFGGDALAATGWNVQIDDPRSEGTWGSTRVHTGALATSSTVSRRWHHGEAIHHHLIDPATNKPAPSPRVAATVWAEEAWWADVVAKVLIIDPTVGRADLDAWSAQGLGFLDHKVELLGLSAERTP